MAQIKTLPLLPGAKFIVVDDGMEITRAESLISGWLQMWNDKGLGNAVELVLFSGPKFVYEKHAEPLKNIDLKFHDYYTVLVEDADRDEAAKLDRIVCGNVLQANSVVIVDCLSSLVLIVGLAKALQFVERLSSRTAQLICVYRRDFGQQKIPRIETLGTTYVRLERPAVYGSERDFIRYQVSLNHRKQGGGILLHRALVFQELASKTYEIVRESSPLPCSTASAGSSSSSSEQASATVASHATTTEKPRASFRIEMNAREQEQRKNTPLPYSPLNATAAVSAPNDSQILYQPDSIDDLDEEDPDDDLPF